MIDVYTDGACTLLKKGGTYEHGPGGYGVAVVKEGEAIDTYCEGFTSTTNNEQELLAILKGIELGAKHDSDITIYSDSAYSINIFTQWVEGWRARGWKRPKNAPIANLGVIQQIYELIHKYNVTFVKVKGHAGNKFNELVDELAVRAKSQFM